MSLIPRALLDQPLLQFLLLGALVFAVDGYLRADADDPRHIVIDDARYAEIAGIFTDNQGHPPSEEQMAELTVKWAQNEVLYREARLMGLDRGDEMIRQRLVLKLRNVLFNRVVTDTPTEQQLAAWFEANRARYDKPEAFDFEQFRVAESDGAKAAAALAAELADGDPPTAWQPHLRRYQRRPFDNLRMVFGAEHAQRLLANEHDTWIPVSSPAGWHLARITGRHAAQRAELADIRSRVLEDWKAQTTQADLAQALQAIASRYDIRVELTAPPEAWDAERIESLRLAMESGR